MVVQPTLESSSNQLEKSEKSICMAAKLNEEVTSVSSSRPETELDLNLKLDEVENRHSTMGKYLLNHYITRQRLINILDVLETTKLNVD